MEFLTGGRQNGQNLYNTYKLYNYINSLQNDTTVRVVKKDGILALCVDKSISKQKIKKVIEELEENINRIKKQYSNGGENCNTSYLENLAQLKILKQILKESEE